MSNLDSLETQFLESLKTSPKEEQDKIITQITNSIPNPNSSSRLALLRGLALESNNNFNSAIEIYTQHSSQLIDKRLLLNSKSIQSCLTYLENYNDQSTWLFLSKLYLMDCCFEESMFCIEQVMLSSLNDPVLLTRFAELAYCDGKIGIAIKYFSAAVDLQDDFVRAWFGLWTCCCAWLKVGKSENEELSKEIVVELKGLAKERLLVLYGENAVIKNLFSS